jgi:hypothetical protein
MRLHNVVPITREDAEEAFASGDATLICDALVRLAYYEQDWRWVQAHCLSFLKHEDRAIAATSATCLGHLARRHRTLDLALVLPALDRLRHDPEIGGRIEDALDDIRMFITSN